MAGLLLLGLFVATAPVPNCNHVIAGVFIGVIVSRWRWRRGR